MAFRIDFPEWRWRLRPAAAEHPRHAGAWPSTKDVAKKFNMSQRRVSEYAVSSWRTGTASPATRPTPTDRLPHHHLSRQRPVTAAPFCLPLGRRRSFTSSFFTPDLSHDHDDQLPRSGPANSLAAEEMLSRFVCLFAKASRLTPSGRITAAWNSRASVRFPAQFQARFLTLTAISARWPTAIATKHCSASWIRQRAVQRALRRGPAPVL